MAAPLRPERLAAILPEMIRLRRLGYTYRAIGERCGVSFSTAKVHCTAHLGATLPECRRLTQEALRLRAEGWPWRRIADYLGYEDATAARAAVRYQRHKELHAGGRPA